MHPQFAILDGEKVAECEAEQWVEWRQGNPETKVGRDEVGGFLVSTVFLGINHAHFGEVRPVWFETMIFEYEAGNKSELGESIYCERYSTMAEAVQGHQVALAWLNARAQAEESGEGELDE